MRGKLLQMLYRLTHPHGLPDAEPVENSARLLAMKRLLTIISNASEPDELARAEAPGDCRVASYRVQPESNLPFLRFYVVDADRDLLALTNTDAPGFEVLQTFCAGLQYHWRSDLVRAFEEETPLISQLYGFSDQREFVLEHLVVPLIRRHRVREVRGWFACSQDLQETGEAIRLERIQMFRRSERAQGVRLPAFRSAVESQLPPAEAMRESAWGNKVAMQEWRRQRSKQFARSGRKC